MNTLTSLLRKSAGLLLATSAASVSLGQVALIGPSTGNGSFEDGILAPWGSGHDVQVLLDPAFASDGDYYASFQSSGVLPVLAVQNLQPDPKDGLAFTLSFDARAGIPGLDVVAPSMSARTSEGASLSATVNPIAVPPVSPSAWQSYEYQLLMPGAWGASGVTFGISFSKNQSLGGITHTAYLDNVVLTQVPEPSTLALLWLAGAVLARKAVNHRRFPAGFSRTKDSLQAAKKKEKVSDY